MPVHTFEWQGVIDQSQDGTLSFSRSLVQGKISFTVTWKIDHSGDQTPKPVLLSCEMGLLALKGQKSLQAARLHFLTPFKSFRPRKSWKEVVQLINEPDILVKFEDFEIRRQKKIGKVRMVLALELEPVHRMTIALSMETFATFLSAKPNDVLFDFPLENISFYANSTILKEASPYFSKYDFAATRDTLSQDATSDNDHENSHKATSKPYSTEDDSDHEGGQHWQRRQIIVSHFRNAQGDHSAGSSKYTVTNFHSLTYIAVLHWIYTGKISFSPLRAYWSPKAEGADPNLALTKMCEVSPKSVYRLASHLQIDSLKSSALSSFSRQLEVDIVAAEMYSRLSGTHPEIRKVTIDFATKNWKEVSATPGMKKVLGEMKKGKGKLPYQEVIGAELLEKLGSMM